MNTGESGQTNSRPNEDQQDADLAVCAGTLAVVTADGAPHMQRVLYTEGDGAFYLAVPPLSTAAAHLRDDRRVCLLLATNDEEETITGLAEQVLASDEADPILARFTASAPQARLLFRVTPSPLVPSEAVEDPGYRRLLVQHIFSDLPDTMARAMSHRLRYETFEPGAIVIQQGSKGDRFFIVVEGEAEVLGEHEGQPDSLLITLGSGESFGESALLLNTPRTATVRARTALRVLALDRHTFEQVVMLSGQED